MFGELIKLVVLFFVIIDPLMSAGLFFSATQNIKNNEKLRLVLISVGVAAILSALFLFFGTSVLDTLQINLTDFEIAGGIILTLLGIQMTIGRAGKESEKYTHENARAIASIIGTPLLTGPATITTIIISTSTYGILLTGLALLIVFLITFLLLYFSTKINKLVGPNITKVITTLLGLITLVYGVAYIKLGLGL